MAVIASPSALCGSRPETGYSGLPVSPFGLIHEHNQSRVLTARGAVSLGRCLAPEVSASRHVPRALTRTRVVRLTPRSGLFGCLTSRLPRVFARQGHSLPKVETRFLLVTLLPLHQAWPVGGLSRASPVPFRASYFTTGLHPPAATAQRCTEYLYTRRDYRLTCASLFVHSTYAPRGAPHGLSPRSWFVAVRAAHRCAAAGQDSYLNRAKGIKAIREGSQPFSGIFEPTDVELKCGGESRGQG